MPKLIKVSVEKQEDGKIIYTYKKTSEKTGHETIIKRITDTKIKQCFGMLIKNVPNKKDLI